MFKRDLVSIIVPVYNVEQYLDKCIESILNQTYSNIEIILIDDGSTDKSNSVCDSFVKKDNRVKCIHKTNEGVSKARQTGAANSSGDWVLFVDSDDEIPSNAIELLVQAQNEYPNTDIVIGGYQYIPKSKFQQYYENEIIGNAELIVRYLDGKIHTGPVAKLFKRTCLTIEDFDIPASIKMGEDLIMNVRIAKKIKNIRIISDNVYCYFVRSNSVCQTFLYTSKYVNVYENHLLQSLDRVFLRQHRMLIYKYKLKNRMKIVKSVIKKILRKKSV